MAIRTIKALLFTAAALLGGPALGAQSAVVQGVVVDRESGAPIRGARVEVSPAGRGVLTAANGRFSLAVGQGREAVVVSALGFAPCTIQLTAGVADTTIQLERTALSLSAVTVTAAPSGRGIGDVAAPVSVLSSRDIERSLGSTLAGTLAREPGITMRSQGPAAAMPIIRGLTGDRIVVLHDGQRTADLASSASDHGVTIDPLSAREIEVVRGPAALLYGSNALGGVVNVISGDIPRLIPAARLTTLSLSGETVTGGGGTLLEVTQPVGDRVAVLLKGGGRSHGNQGLGGADGVLINTSARNRSFVAGLGYAAPSVSAGMAYRHYAFEYGLPVRDDPAGGVRLRGGRHELTGRWQADQPRGLQQLRVEGTAQWYDHDEVLTNGEVATALALTTQQLQAIATTRSRGVLAGGAFGASMLRRVNGVQGAQALTPPSDAFTLGLVAFQDIAPSRSGRIRLPLAVRLERTDMTSRTTAAFGPSVARRFDALSFSGGLVIPVGHGSTLALNAARAVRAPSAEELFSRAGHAGTGAFEIGNPGLSGEITQGLDAVWRVDRPQLRVQVAAFHSRVNGWIGMYPSGRDTTIVAGGVTKDLPLFMISQVPARLSGAELLAERSLGSLVIGGTGDVVVARDASGEALPFMPPVRLGGTTRWDTKRWQLGTATRYVFGQTDVAPSEVATGGFLLTDLWAGLQFGAGASVHHVMLRVDNAADRWSRDATSRAKDFAANPGRSLSLSYRLTW